MKYILQYTKQATEDLEEINRVDSQKIVKKLGFFISQWDPMKYSSSLKGNYKHLYRFRIGSYRVIFEKDLYGNITILTIIRIAHRKDVYNN